MAGSFNIAISDAARETDSVVKNALSHRAEMILPSILVVGPGKKRFSCGRNGIHSSPATPDAVVRGKAVVYVKPKPIATIGVFKIPLATAAARSHLGGKSCSLWM